MITTVGSIDNSLYDDHALTRYRSEFVRHLVNTIIIIKLRRLQVSRATTVLIERVH